MAEADTSIREYNRKRDFTRTSEPKGQAAKSLGIKRSMGLLPGRETFVLDGEGIVRHVFRSQFGATQHVEEALRVVKGLA